MADWTSLDIEWDQDLDVTIQLVILALITLRYGMAVRDAAAPGSWIDAVATWSLFTVAFVLAGLTATNIQLEDYGRHLATATLAAYVLGALAMASEVPALGTDAMMFSRESVDVLLAGGNPYTASMQDSFQLPGAAYGVATARFDGTMVDSWSYPGGAILLFAPARLLDIEIRYIVLAAATVLAGLVILVSPPEWALTGLLTMILARDFTYGAIAGLMDQLWMLPLAISMLYWARNHLRTAAFAFGLAAGIKQQPWLITPFLTIWVYKTTHTHRGFLTRALSLNAAGLLGFLLLNAPFIAMNPDAWIHGITTPIRGSPMVPTGAGLVLLNRLGLYTTTIWWHQLAVALTTIWLTLWYFLDWERVKWLAWVLPVAILAMNYRSLLTYYTAFIPLLWIAILAHQERLDTTWLPAPRPRGGRPA